MRIRVKLMGILKQKTPEDQTLALEDGATIADALAALKVPIDSVQVFTVNGQLERDAQRRLSDGDEFTALPPVAGG
jgi:molybdopterin converting factor small subunit